MAKPKQLSLFGLSSDMLTCEHLHEETFVTIVTFCKCMGCAAILNSKISTQRVGASGAQAPHEPEEVDETPPF